MKTAQSGMILRIIRSVRPVFAAVSVLAMSGFGLTDSPSEYVAGSLVRLNNNGAWSWFMDERAVVHNNKLIVGSVRSQGEYTTGRGQKGWGDIEVAVYDLAKGTISRTVLDAQYEQDDHNAPAFLALPDGRLLAAYSKHARERKVRLRISAPNDPNAWGEALDFATPGQERTFAGDNVTYSNLFRLSDGRVCNFFRGFGHDPNWMYSDDCGRTWSYGGRLLKGRDGYSPYLKYAFDGDQAVHFIATEDHPRNFDNSIYHGVLKNGRLFRSDGSPLTDLTLTADASVSAWDFTPVFKGDPDHVAWPVDIELDADRRPRVVFSVQRDGRGLPPFFGGKDLRYYYGRWDGERWLVREMAYAGRRLYPLEDDYSGLAAIHPAHPELVFISTDAHPQTGRPLISAADGRRHYEIFQGVSRDGGATWEWRPITANSATDNLRPIVPKWNDERTALVWMRGTYESFRGRWTTSVVAVIFPPAAPSQRAIPTS